ncbi:MAG TPA: dUTP diphosphatase [Bacillota bacterium]|nr:dUTP diphosphatase [Bacillota bacterium]
MTDMAAGEAVRVGVARAPGSEDLPLPRAMTCGSAGLDLPAAVTDLEIAPGERAVLPTGLHLEIPRGYEGQVRPRSGLAAEHGLTVLNSPGTIDSDYRGEIKVVLVNLGREPVVIRRGDRVAQLIIAPVCQVSWDLRPQLASTDRAEGGLGHTRR